jgi:hypothetical protein
MQLNMHTFIKIFCSGNFFKKIQILKNKFIQ